MIKFMRVRISLLAPLIFIGEIIIMDAYTITIVVIMIIAMIVGIIGIVSDTNR